jgi:uncharacterized RDD family membrane protein YckC
VQTAPPAVPEPEPPSVTVLIEPGAGVWAPAPDAAATPEEGAPAPAPSERAHTAPFVTPAAMPAAQPAYSARYAGFWRRFAALLIDWFVFSSIEIFIAAVRGIPLNARPSTEPEVVAKAFLINLVIFWLYWAISESSPWQATIGKRAMDVYVTDLKGRRIGFGQASGRFFGKIVSFLILGIGFLMIGFSGRKQALHDLLAGCLVVRRQD